MYLKSIANFRALAIIFIVLGHLYVYGLLGESATLSVIKNIITGGTALFVFISGFMFHYVFFDRFNYAKFLKGKLKNVLLPYIILSTIAIVIFFVMSMGYFGGAAGLPVDAYAPGNIFSIDDSSLVTFIKYYLSGRVLTAYWYIPFVFLVFLMSPLHMVFIRLHLKYQVAILLILSVVSLLAHRSVANTNAIHLLIYYTPMYLTGILTSMYACDIKKYLDGKLLYLMLLIIFISFLEYVSGHQGNYHKLFFDYNGVDFLYIQKFFLVFFFYALFDKFYFDFKVMNVISDTSFAIFFIHPWVILFISIAFRKFEIEIPEYNILIYIVSFFFVISLSVFSALLLKKIFRNHNKKTRYIIGY